LQGGWLVFQSAREKRRLVPIPPGWASMSDAQLLELLGRSTYAGPPRRLIE